MPLCSKKGPYPPTIVPNYRKWLRYYLDFCQKYDFEPSDSNSLPHFIDILRQKRQSDVLRKQAFHTVTLYHEMIAAVGDGGTAAQVDTEHYFNSGPYLRGAVC